MKKILTLFIALILVTGIVSVAKSTDIDTSVPWASATAYSRNRHIVQSSNGTIVVLYQRGSGTDPGLRAKKSTNFGSSWTNLAGGAGSTQIDSTIYSYYSICIDDNDNIYVVYMEDSVIIRFMKLIYSGGSWSNGTERTVVSTGDNANPFIIRESGGRIWVAYGYDDGTPAGVKAIRSDNEFQSAGTVSTVYTYDDESDESFYPALTIRNSYPFLVLSDRMASVKWSAWNGSSWSGIDPVSGSFCDSGNLSVTMIGSDVHIVGIYGDYIKHIYYNGSNWSSPETIQTASYDKDRSPSLTTDDANLWCFAAIYYEDSSSSYSKYDIKYKKRTGSTWGASWTAITSTHMDCDAGTPSISRQKIPLAWTRGSSTPYTAKFDYSIIIDITAPGAPTGVNATPSGWTSTNSFNVNWTNPSDPSGIAGAYYKLDSVPTSDTDGTWRTDKPITGITVSGDGAHPIYIWLKDNSYNVNYQNRGSTTCYLDATPPGAPTITSASHPTEGTWYSNNDPSFGWSGLSDTSGITGYSYVWDHAPTTTPDTQTEGPGTSKNYTDEADGTWYFHVRARNGSNLWGAADHYQVNIDAT
ncbi:MAG TPA: hypothetical protein VMW39_04025, partial [bacterium]|nr:hypothetical protein [bacterium]